MNAVAAMTTTEAYNELIRAFDSLGFPILESGAAALESYVLASAPTSTTRPPSTPRRRHERL